MVSSVVDPDRRLATQQANGERPGGMTTGVADPNHPIHTGDTLAPTDVGSEGIARQHRSRDRCVGSTELRCPRVRACTDHLVPLLHAARRTARKDVPRTDARSALLLVFPSSARMWKVRSTRGFDFAIDTSEEPIRTVGTRQVHRRRGPATRSPRCRAPSSMVAQPRREAASLTPSGADGQRDESKEMGGRTRPSQVVHRPPILPNGAISTAIDPQKPRGICVLHGIIRRGCTAPCGIRHAAYTFRAAHSRVRPCLAWIVEPRARG